jgi:hypothetical protein
MRSSLRIAAIAFILSLVSSGYAITQAADIPLHTTAQVYSSPHGGCTEAIVREIGKG